MSQSYSKGEERGSHISYTMYMNTSKRHVHIYMYVQLCWRNGTYTTKYESFEEIRVHCSLKTTNYVVHATRLVCKMDIANKLLPEEHITYPMWQIILYIILNLHRFLCQKFHSRVWKETVLQKMFIVLSYELQSICNKQIFNNYYSILLS